MFVKKLPIGKQTFKDLIDNCWYGINELEEVDLAVDDIDSLDLKILSVIPVLHQTGYLTIKSYNPDSGNLTLTFPNHEVRVAFFRHLLSRKSSCVTAKLNFDIEKRNLTEWEFKEIGI